MSKFCLVEFDNCLCKHKQILSSEELTSLYEKVEEIDGKDNDSVEKYQSFDFPLSEHQPNLKLVDRLEKLQADDYLICAYSDVGFKSIGFKYWWLQQNISNINFNFFGSGAIDEILKGNFDCLKNFQEDSKKDIIADDVIIINKENLVD